MPTATSVIYNVLFFLGFDVWEEPLHFQFVFGVFGGLSFTPLTYVDIKSGLPAGATWSTCGVGPLNQLSAAMMSAITGSTSGWVWRTDLPP